MSPSTERAALSAALRVAADVAEAGDRLHWAALMREAALELRARQAEPAPQAAPEEAPSEELKLAREFAAMSEEPPAFTMQHNAWTLAREVLRLSASQSYVALPTAPTMGMWDDFCAVHKVPFDAFEKACKAMLDGLRRDAAAPEAKWASQPSRRCHGVPRDA